MEELKIKWQKVLNLLEKEVSVVSFDMWIKSLDVLDIVDGVLILEASSTVAKNQCLNNYNVTLKFCINEIFGDEVSAFEVLNPEEADNLKNKIKENSTVIATKTQQPSTFNPKYTFDNFVVGKSNQFVCAAAKNIAENPSSKINPLFIYGGTGLGKTHLLHAIGNYLKTNKPELKTMYVTCEKFTNDYIYSLRNTNKEKSITMFREKYRNMDVLMVDDIQFISNKTETQEEFFHTFNDLYQNNKQVIIASDRPPREISTLSERLKSRFASGLIQDIQLPDFETRVAILKKKAEEEHYNLEEDVIIFLAENSSSNVREMEGLLGKVVFYANLIGKHFATIEDAKIALKDEIEQEKQFINTDLIMERVCSYFNISREELVGKKKNKEFVEPRMICVYLITEMMDIPLANIGTIFGGRDHTTIMHSRDKITTDLKTDSKLKVIVNDIKSLILKK